jgi:cyclopropane fatty-acyl-phospholipid synthase-like methyltransferase
MTYNKTKRPRPVATLLTGQMPGDTVVAVGSGFGGPARRIAEQTAATVVGIDVTLADADAAETLNSRMGFGESVRFQ